MRALVALLTLCLSWGALAESLAIATFNTGYLNAVVATVPDYKQRLQHFPSELESFLLTNENQIIALQEVWHLDAANAVLGVTEKLNYVSAARALHLQHEKWSLFGHGMDILIPKKYASSLDVSLKYFESESGDDLRASFEKSLGIKRGALIAKFKIGKKKIAIVTTHLTPTIEHNELRAEQVQALAQVIKDLEKNHHVFLAGDFNFSPLFNMSLETEYSGSDSEWKANGQSYFALKRETEMIDTFAEKNPNTEGYTQDRTANDLTRDGAYTAEEPEQRLDYIWYKSKSKACEVSSSNLIFTKPIEASGKVLMSAEDPKRRLFLSDHFGINTVFDCP